MAANNKLVTNYFRLHNVKQFIESISEPANTIYYVFAGKPGQYTLGDNIIDAPQSSIENLYTNVYDEMEFAKKINSNDVAIMAPKTIWTTGTAYDMYDSQDTELESKNFFVVSPEGGTYYIYKCLFNNNGANSTSQPLFSSTGADDLYYETADGYVWKYLYKVDATTFNKFATDLYMPVVEDANVTANAISGAIDIIKIEDNGIYYNNYLDGSFTASDVRYAGDPLKYRLTSGEASSINDFYEGCIIKIISGTGAGQYRTITNYSVSGGFKFIFIDTPFNVTPTSSTYEISPQIKVYGDGRETVNVVARALVNTNSSNSVYKIDILNKGKDYFYATANVYASPVVRTSNSVNDASLRPIISPRGGHGFDVAAELYASHLGISVKFSNSENGTISTDNDFRTIGVLKDPAFKDVKLTYDTLKGLGFSDTEELAQMNLKALGGSVSVSQTSKQIYGLAAFSSLIINSAGNTTYSNSDIITISNVAVNAVCSLVTNATGYIISANVVSGGFGFSDATSPVISISNSTSGNVRNVNGSIVTGYSISNGGLAYTSSDYLEISGPLASINATANIVANSTGGITSIVITNSGRGLYSNSFSIKIANSSGGYANGARVANVDIVTNGADGLYSNTDFIVFPSYANSSGNAVANLVTSSTGNISSITVNAGNNYGFNFNENVVSYAANSTGGYLRYFDTQLVKSITVANSSPGYRIANVSITANGQNYDSTKVLRVDINDGGIGYNSTANNILVFTGGSGSGANATFVNNSLGSIISITMVANGTGYTSAPTVTPDATANGIGANLSAILANSISITSTTGGYGGVVYFTNTASGNIATTVVANQGFNYSSAPSASISDPIGSDATFTVNITGGADNFATNDLVILASNTYASINATANIVANSTGFVSSITVTSSGRNANTGELFVSNSSLGNVRYFDSTIVKEVLVTSGGYSGFCSNSDILKIVNSSINATGNVVTNTVGGLTTVNITNSGKGFTNGSSIVPLITNSTGGHIRYLNSNIVSSHTIVDVGTGYNNTDYLVIASDGAISAVANIVTNVIGEISDISFSNRGKDLIPWKVANIDIVVGGTGYSNADKIVFSGGSGSGANAILLTNSTGGIVRTFLLDGGINYDSAPTISIANSIGGTANGSSANLVASLSRPTTVRIYNANNLPSDGTFADIKFTISPSPAITANLVYSPNVNIVYATAAKFTTNLVESANLVFTTNSAADISVSLQGQTTSFDNSLGVGEYVYLVDVNDNIDLLKIDSITNASHFTVETFPAFTSNSVKIFAANVFATGNILDRSTNIVNVTNVHGFFKQANLIYGLSSKSSANVISISFNGIVKSGTVVNQLFYYEVASSSGTFEEDETLTSGDATAKYHSGNTTTLYVTSQKGNFYAGNTLIGSNGSITLSSSPTYKYEGDFIRGSGDIIYIENIQPISRSNSQSETIKLVLEF